MASTSPQSRAHLKNKPVSQVQLRFAQALRDAGFSVEYRVEWGRSWLVYGFGQAALSQKLERAVTSLKNKFMHEQAFEYAEKLINVLKAYANGTFLS